MSWSHSSLVSLVARAAAVAVAATLLATPAAAQHAKSGSATAAKKPVTPAPAPANDGGPTSVDPKTGQKSKQYTFGGLDIDGKLKTPQLLYFLNRMKSEFDTTTPDKRSFIPELKRSTDEM
jgi:hypothetical protein